jgi:hypothetical protein
MYSGTQRVSAPRCSIEELADCIDRTLPQVMVISSEGYFYSYNIDLENGGECSLMKQYRFVGWFYPPSLPTSLLIPTFLTVCWILEKNHPI